MFVVVHCTACQQPVRAEEASLGRRLLCPRCGESFIAEESHPQYAPVESKPTHEVEPIPLFNLSDEKQNQPEPAPPSEQEAIRRDVNIARTGPGKDGNSNSFNFWGILALGSSLVGVLFDKLGLIDRTTGMVLGFIIGLLAMMIILIVIPNGWTVASKRKFSMSLSLGSFALTAVVLFVMYLAGPDSIDPDSWARQVISGGNCEIQFPGTPTIVPLRDALGDFEKGELYEVDLIEAESLFALSYVDFTPAGLENHSIDSRLQRHQLQLRRIYSNSVDVRAITMKGNRGKEFKVKLRNARGYHIERFYIVEMRPNIRLYSLIARGPSITPGSENAKRFFESFRLNLK